MAIQDDIAGYRAAVAARAEAQRKSGEISLGDLLANERALYSRLLPNLVPGVSYPWEPGLVLIRQKSAFSDRAIVVATGQTVGDVAVPVAPPGHAIGVMGTVRLGLVLLFLAFVVAYSHPDWSGLLSHIPNPFAPEPPAYVAAVAMDRGVATLMASSFRQAAADIRAGKSLADAKAANQARTKGAADWKAADPIIPILNAIIPPGDETKATAQQLSDYAAALETFAAGWASRSK